MPRIDLTTDAELTSFGRDLGTGTALPTVAGDGSALRRGDVYLHTGLGSLMVWAGSGWKQTTTSGIDPASLAATYSAILPFGFRVLYNGADYVWDGAGWETVPSLIGAAAPLVGSLPGSFPPKLQAGTPSVTTNSSSIGAFSWPTPFPNGVIGVTLTSLSDTITQLRLISGGVSASQCQFVARLNNGNGAGAATFSVSYIAIGW